MGKKYYAVRVGLKPGVYSTWDECKAQIFGVSGAEYKSFKTEAEAKNYIQAKETMESLEPVKKNYAYVDGSYNAEITLSGCGGFLVDNNGEKHIIQDNILDTDGMRNVTGEILGAMRAIEKAIELGMKELVIYYDYTGIEMWATGYWKRNKPGTRNYYNFIQAAKEKINLKFVHVKGHTGIEGNEEADRLAKDAVFILQ